jgi:hypothetical protein
VKSNGRPEIRSTVAPSEPSSVWASADFWTFSELNSSEAKVLNWKPRSRRRAPSALLAPEVDRVSSPFSRTRVKSPPRPRTEIELPSPFSRSIETPGIR